MDDRQILAESIRDILHKYLYSTYPSLSFSAQVLEYNHYPKYQIAIYVYRGMLSAYYGINLFQDVIRAEDITCPYSDPDIMNIIIRGLSNKCNRLWRQDLKE